ncbi:MAG: neutral/alkaline non-lysosomal ceramidase N-terminal domain-containing protein [Phycisphaerae bacterium]|nr:neutral/alkaline non-lysosomal ceramidase N-terminal domain-containing protein [Phycisphaerae bacterium]
MLAGFASIDITPPAGAVLNGFIARTSASTGIDTPLSARALVFDDEPIRAALVSFDLLGLSPALADRLVAKLGCLLDIPSDQVVLASTHTHSGPMTARLRGIGDEDAPYLARLERAAVIATQGALADLQPVQASWGSASVKLAHNRRQKTVGPEGLSVILGRNPTGPTETTVRVLSLRGVNRSILLFHHACHPYCLGGDSTLISADFWGYAAEALTAQGHACIYLNGCCGDLSPELAFGGPKAARATGYTLAEAVLRGLQASRRSHRDMLAVQSHSFSLPYDRVPPLQLIKAELGRADKTVRDSERDNPIIVERVRRAWQEWLADLEAALSSNGQLPPLPVRISILRLGDGAIVALPGEMFYETGRDLAACLKAEPVCVAGYCHGYIGYIPTPESFPLGGYEVEEAHRYIGLWRVSPQTTSLIRNQVLSLWNSCGGAVHEHGCVAGRT